MVAPHAAGGSGPRGLPPLHVRDLLRPCAWLVQLLGAVLALYWYLVYHPQALSWDVMEPVTYFTLEGTAIGWWLLYICSSREASLSDLRQGWVEKACRKQYGEPWAQPRVVGACRGFLR